MSNQTQTARVKPIAATTPTIYNLSMPSAGTEYSQVLNNSVKKLTIRMRIPSVSRIAFVSGATSVSYITLNPSCVYSEESLDLNGATIFLQSTVNGQTAEILEWT